MPTGFITDELFKTHDTGPMHPERAVRMDAVRAAAQPMLDDGRLVALPATPAAHHAVTRCHGEAYYALAEREIAEGWAHLSTGDTPVCEASWDAALLAAGACINAVDAVISGATSGGASGGTSGGVANAFVAARPPGHHAEPGAGMGFCIFDNIAIGARHAQAEHGVERVLIVDWDVHHGNGTQAIFYDDPSVLFFSTHQSGLYPPNTGFPQERGAGAGEGYTINVPIVPGGGRKEVFAAFEHKLLPAVEAFKPGLVMISAGFDSRVGDPLGDLRLTDRDFADLTRMMMRVADAHCSGKLVSVLEGGYDLEGLHTGVPAHLRALCGDNAGPERE